MTKRTLSIVAFASVLAVLAPLSITTSAAELNCRVPFSFVVGSGKIMAPGLYTISTGQGYMIMKGVTGQSAIALAITGKEHSGGARLVFLKTGNRYDLSEVWSGDGHGLQLPPAKRHGDDRRASDAPAERIVIAAV